MAMQWNALRSISSPVVAWLGVLSNPGRILFGSLPNLRDAFRADGLPLSFVLRRDSNRRKVGNGKRHNPMPPALNGIDRVASIPVVDQRPHVRSALRANADRRKDDRAA
jgi:hypothetical protein